MRNDQKQKSKKTARFMTDEEREDFGLLLMMK
jgi:hypothetical protein